MKHLLKHIFVTFAVLVAVVAPTAAQSQGQRIDSKSNCRSTSEGVCTHSKAPELGKNVATQKARPLSIEAQIDRAIEQVERYNKECFAGNETFCYRSVLQSGRAGTRTETERAGAKASGSACAENGTCYGDISSLTGRPKTVSVDGYYRKDGTYVRGHYRSPSKRR